MFRKVLPYILGFSLAYAMNFKGMEDGRIVLDSAETPIVINMNDSSCTISVKPTSSLEENVFKKFKDLQFKFSPKIEYDGSEARVFLKASYIKNNSVGDSTFIPGGKYVFSESCSGEEKTLDVIVYQGVVFNLPDKNIVEDNSPWDISKKENTIQVGFYTLIGGMEKKIVEYYGRETNLEKILPYNLEETGFLAALTPKPSITKEEGKKSREDLPFFITINPGSKHSYEINARVKLEF